ncbi:HAD-IIA family hydrolase [Ornithinimicrobium sp. Y1847]|uniref:HAD-IIA family hydrolase n=1 Tax=unclassified Ornithinimicrobium TaxID=2615080 RepID=UPI003B66CFAB
MRVRGILCDLDGVVYRGEVACPGAVEGLDGARKAGVRVLFMTNNASRRPEVVADQLVSLGVDAEGQDVLTASQVAATLLAEGLTQGRWELPESRQVLAVGGEGVAAALRERGLDPVSPGRVREQAGRRGSVPAIVVQGYGGALTPPDLSEIAYALADGAIWIATNDDSTLPTPRGFGLGNGSLIAAVSHATGRVPDAIAGKPHPGAYQVALERLGLVAEDCLMIGDRLDTDISGAVAAGIPSALVLTGVASAQDAEQAPQASRPDHVVHAITDLEHLWSPR